MRFDDLFEQRILVADKLKDCIREKGFTKVVFAKKTGISRPTLDKLLLGTVDNKSSFDKHMQKILAVLYMSVDELMFFNPAPEKVKAVFSQNAPEDYRMSEKAQKQYNILMDILNLCTVYY